VASELNPAEQKNQKSGESRRSFLAKLGIGAAALALVAGSLSSIRGLGSSNSQAAKNMEFPDEDSIFHPAVDPRQDPRRTGRG
jgi:hypothetical protein